MKKFGFSRITAFLTALIFIAVEITAPIPGFAQLIHPPLQSPNGVEIQSSLKVAPMIPDDLGTVQTFTQGSGPVVFHIQTAHGNYEAQKKIESILHYLKDHYGVKLLLLEGSAFKLKPEILKFFPERMDLTLKVADELTKHALVKGAELFLLQNSEAQGQGIEQVELYRQNREAFKTVLLAQEKTQAFVGDMDRQIEALTAPYLNKNLRSFLNELEHHENGGVSLQDWLIYLKTQAQTYLKMDLADPANQLNWPMLVRIYKLKELESKIDLQAYAKEKPAFLKAIRRIPKDIFGQIEALLNAPVSYHKLPDPDTEILFEQMVEALPADFNYGAYPNVTYTIGRLLLQSEIKGELLINELNALAEEITSNLAESKEEKEIVTLLGDYRLLTRLFSLELTPDDYEAILKRNNVLVPSAVIKRFLELNRSGRVRNIKFTHVHEINSLFQKALEFYRFVKKRDTAMLENAVAKINELKADKAVVITGGFHSEPFQNFFAEKNYNYALISPKITSLDEEGHKAYVQSILQTPERVKTATLENAYLSLQKSELRALGIDTDWLQDQVRPVVSRVSQEEKISSKQLMRRRIIEAEPVNEGPVVIGGVKVTSGLLSSKLSRSEARGDSVIGRVIVNDEEVSLPVNLRGTVRIDEILRALNFKEGQVNQVRIIGGPQSIPVYSSNGTDGFGRTTVDLNQRGIEIVALVPETAQNIQTIELKLAQVVPLELRFEGSRIIITDKAINKEFSRTLRNGEIIKIGRHTDNDVVLAHDLVSRSHLEIMHENKIWSMRDVGSTHGTFFHDEKLENNTWISVPSLSARSEAREDLPILFRELARRLGEKGYQVSVSEKGEGSIAYQHKTPTSESTFSVSLNEDKLTFNQSSYRYYSYIDSGIGEPRSSISFGPNETALDSFDPSLKPPSGHYLYKGDNPIEGLGFNKEGYIVAVVSPEFIKTYRREKGDFGPRLESMPVMILASDDERVKELEMIVPVRSEARDLEAFKNELFALENKILASSNDPKAVRNGLLELILTDRYVSFETYRDVKKGFLVDHSLWRLFQNEFIRKIALDIARHLHPESGMFTQMILVTILGRFITPPHQDQDVKQYLESILKSPSANPQVQHKAGDVLGRTEFPVTPPSQEEDAKLARSEARTLSDGEAKELMQSLLKNAALTERTAGQMNHFARMTRLSEQLARLENLDPDTSFQIAGVIGAFLNAPSTANISTESRIALNAIEHYLTNPDQKSEGALVVLADQARKSSGIHPWLPLVLAGITVVGAISLSHAAEPAAPAPSGAIFERAPPGIALQPIKESIPALLNILKFKAQNLNDIDAVGRQDEMAMDVLSRIGKPAATTLVELLNTDMADVPAEHRWFLRYQIVLTLGRLADASAVPALIKLLESESYAMVQYAIVDSLGQIKDKSSVPVLIKTLKQAAPAGQDEYLRALLAKALGEIGDPAAIPVLIEEFKSVDGMSLIDVRKIKIHASVVEMLKATGFRTKGSIYIGAEGLRRTLVKAALAQMGSKAIVPVVKVLQEDQRWYIQVDAIEVLSGLGPEVLPYLTQATQSKDEDVKAAATSAIEKIKTPALAQPPGRSEARYAPVRAAIGLLLSWEQLAGQAEASFALRQLYDRIDNSEPLDDHLAPRLQTHLLDKEVVLLAPLRQALKEQSNTPAEKDLSRQLDTYHHAFKVLETFIIDSGFVRSEARVQDTVQGRFPELFSTKLEDVRKKFEYSPGKVQAHQILPGSQEVAWAIRPQSNHEIKPIRTLFDGFRNALEEAVSGDSQKIYLPIFDQLRINLGGRFSEVSLPPLDEKTIEDARQIAEAEIGKRNFKSFTLEISSARLAADGTVVLEVKDSAHLFNLRIVLIDTLIKALEKNLNRRLTEPERKQFRMPERDGNISHGGVMTIARIVPKRDEPSTFIDDGDLQRLEKVVKEIDREVKVFKLSLPVDTLSLIHLGDSDREYLEHMPAAKETTVRLSPRKLDQNLRDQLQRIVSRWKEAISEESFIDFDKDLQTVKNAQTDESVMDQALLYLRDELKKFDQTLKPKRRNQTIPYWKTLLHRAQVYALLWLIHRKYLHLPKFMGEEDRLAGTVLKFTARSRELYFIQTGLIKPRRVTNAGTIYIPSDPEKLFESVISAFGGGLHIEVEAGLPPHTGMEGSGIVAAALMQALITLRKNPDQSEVVTTSPYRWQLSSAGGSDNIVWARPQGMTLLGGPLLLGNEPGIKIRVKRMPNQKIIEFKSVDGKQEEAISDFRFSPMGAREPDLLRYPKIALALAASLAPGQSSGPDAVAALGSVLEALTEVYGGVNSVMVSGGNGFSFLTNQPDTYLFKLEEVLNLKQLEQFERLVVFLDPGATKKDFRVSTATRQVNRTILLLTSSETRHLMAELASTTLEMRNLLREIPKSEKLMDRFAANGKLRDLIQDLNTIQEFTNRAVGVVDPQIGEVPEPLKSFLEKVKARYKEKTEADLGLLVQGAGPTGVVLFLAANKSVLENILNDFLPEYEQALKQAGIYHPDNPPHLLDFNFTDQTMKSVFPSNGRSEARLSPEQETLLDEAARVFKLTPANKEYLKQMWKQRLFEDPSKKPLKVILDRNNPAEDENYLLTAQLTADELGRLFGAYDYLTQWYGKSEYAEAAKNAYVAVYSLDGGLGESLARWLFKEYLVKEGLLSKDEVERDETGKIRLAAKGRDIGFIVEIKGKKVFISVTEAKFLQLMHIADQKKIGGLAFKPLVNKDSLPSYEKLFDQIYLSDRLDDSIPRNKKRTYRQVLAEKGVEILEPFMQQDLPGINAVTGEIGTTLSASAQPGGHGQLGFGFLYAPEDWKPRSDGKKQILYFTNGDNLNSSRVDEFVIGAMLKLGIPILKVTTPATRIDTKGGKDGIKLVRIGNKIFYVPQQWEVADAKAVGQADAFAKAGQPDGIKLFGEASVGRQQFNTNIFGVFEDKVFPLLADIKAHYASIGEVEKYYEIISPTRIQKDPKTGKDGEQYEPIDGAIGTAIHNLNEFIMLTQDPAIIEILERHGIVPDETGTRRILNFVNVPRTPFFVPIKDSIGAWVQAFGGYYYLDLTEWVTKEVREGLVLPEMTLNAADNYYKELQNLNESLGTHADITRLDDLDIKGKIKAINATYVGKVAIINETDKLVNLRSPQYRNALKSLFRGNKLVLENVSLTFKTDGSVELVNRSEARGEVQDLKQKLEVLAADPTTQLTPERINEILTRVESGQLQLAEDEIEVIKIENGNEIVIGPVDVVIAHAYGLFHRTANAFVVTPEGNLLILRRAHNIQEPLTLSIFGGHLVPGENYRQAVEREIREELGLPENWVLQGRFEQIGTDGAYVSPADDQANREVRSLYIYRATDDELIRIRKRLIELSENKRKQTKEQFESLVTLEQARKTGFGEVWGIYELSLTQLLNIAKGDRLELTDRFRNEKVVSDAQLSTDLLQPLLEEGAAVKILRQAIPQVFVRTVTSFHGWQKLTTDLSRQMAQGTLKHVVFKISPQLGEEVQTEIIDINGNIANQLETITRKVLGAFSKDYEDKSQIRFQYTFSPSGDTLTFENYPIQSEDQLSEIPDAQLKAWILEQARLTRPAKIVVVDQSTIPGLLKEAAQKKIIFEVNDPIAGKGWLARSNKEDAQRVVNRTFIASSNKEDKGYFNNWISTDELHQKVDPLLKDSMQGQTMYVLPFLMGPEGSPRSRWGVELSNSFTTTFNMNILNKVGQAAWNNREQFGREPFGRGVHSIGDLDDLAKMIANEMEDQRYYVSEIDGGLVISYLSDYGGNVIQSKKHLGLRVADARTQEEGNGFAAHMLVLGIRNKKTGKTYYVMDARPSMVGKTNGATIEPPDYLKDTWETFTVSDDLAWPAIGSDGRLRAIPPEHGMFIVIKDISKEKNQRLFDAIARDPNKFFTNVAYNPATKEVYWEGKLGYDANGKPIYPENKDGWLDWLGTPISESKEPLWINKNARVTVAINAVDNWIGHVTSRSASEQPTDWNHPEGVPIDLILWGARVSDGEPSVRLFNDIESAVTAGFFMVSESTAAKKGAEGVLEEDPYAMANFLARTLGAHAENMLKVLTSDQLKAKPKMGMTNPFRKTSDGKFVLGGYDNNFLRLLWMLEDGKGTKTPIGVIPSPDSPYFPDLQAPQPELANSLRYVPLYWLERTARADGFVEKITKEGDWVPEAISNKREELTKQYLLDALALLPKFADRSRLGELVNQLTDNIRNNNFKQASETLSALQLAISSAPLPGQTQLDQVLAKMKPVVEVRAARSETRKQGDIFEEIKRLTPSNIQYQSLLQNLRQAVQSNSPDQVNKVGVEIKGKAPHLSTLVDLALAHIRSNSVRSESREKIMTPIVLRVAELFRGGIFALGVVTALITNVGKEAAATMLTNMAGRPVYANTTSGSISQQTISILTPKELNSLGLFASLFEINQPVAAHNETLILAENLDQIPTVDAELELWLQYMVANDIVWSIDFDNVNSQEANDWKKAIVQKYGINPNQIRIYVSSVSGFDRSVTKAREIAVYVAGAKEDFDELALGSTMAGRLLKEGNPAADRVMAARVLQNLKDYLNIRLAIVKIGDIARAYYETLVTQFKAYLKLARAA